MKNLLAGCTALFFLTAEAQAQSGQNWACAYDAYYGGGQAVRYVRDGADLVDERFRIRYRIVHETPEALMAVLLFERAASDPDGAGISSAMILIDKRSGAFTRSNASVPNHEDDRPISGTCISG
jgi:hypothetical protein